ncbi:MAG: sulfotransferase [Steroidobacteraceae bacterium]
MKLAQPFFRLPLRFDVARLREEVASLPESAWADHPNKLDGNSSVRLISAGGGENDAVDGPMLPTPHLARLPYVQQVLASFGVVWSRSRLMRLTPGADVPPHSDINGHWFSRVRVHIPILTRPEVRFHCGDADVHMAAGEAWIFDNWRPHRVENRSPEQRIHLVADTTGSAAFWQLVARSMQAGVPVMQHRYDPAAPLPRLLTEQAETPMAMPPSEVDIFAADLKLELHATGPDAARNVATFAALIDEFCRDWRQLFALHGQHPAGRGDYARLRDRLREVANRLGEGLVMRTNGTAALRVLEARLLRAVLRDETARATKPGATSPTFIVAAPRSGSTLLFETLASHSAFATFGGEAHWLVEDDPALRPGAPDVDSNRLTADHASATVIARIRAQTLARATPTDRTRLLEKTPKNALRVPFFDRVFPDARFVFLWRDPRENLASIIEAWAAGRWVTYPALPGWDGPWSLLLPPHWQALEGQAVADIAAWQWAETHRVLLADLERLAPDRWIALNYADLVAAPAPTLERVCRFLDIATDDPGLAERLAAPLPPSRYTLTPPSPDKWRRHANEIARVLPRLEPVWARLRALS